MHAVAVVGEHLIDHVPTEVCTEKFFGVASLPGETGEGFSERLDRAFVCVAGGHAQKFLRYHAGEASLLQLADKPMPSLFCLARGGQRRLRISRRDVSF